MSVLWRLLLVGLVFLVWTPAAFAWSWPVDGPVLQAFAYDVSHPYAAGQHRGVDIGTDSTGESVAAPAAGTVAFAGSVPTSGKCVTIETADGYSVTLTHLGSIGVAKGATVAEGAVVGTVGPSGTPELDRPYVHLGIRLTADPLGYVDPLGLLPALDPPPPPAPESDSGSAGSSAPAAPAPPPPAPPAPTASTASAADEPAVSADPAPATSSPEPTRADPIATAGHSEPVAGSRKPVPMPSVSTGSNENADLAGPVDGATAGKTGNGDRDSAEPDRSSEPVGTPVEAASHPAHAPARRASGAVSGAVEALPAESGVARMNGGQRPLRSPVSEPSASPLQGPETTSLLSLVLGVGPGLLALTAAFAVALGRLRHRAVDSAVVAAAVVRLPGRGERIRSGAERRAA